jgi:hypothetical protein
VQSRAIRDDRCQRHPEQDRGRRVTEVLTARHEWLIRSTSADDRVHLDVDRTDPMVRMRHIRSAQTPACGPVKLCLAGAEREAVKVRLKRAAMRHGIHSGKNAPNA